jgi:cytochrome c-type biogenesis protein CcmH
MTDRITALREKLQQLDAQHATGTLGKSDHAKARAAIERELLDHVLERPATPHAATDKPRVSRNFVALLSVAVLAIAIAGYAWTGSPSLISGVPYTPQAAGGKSPHDAIDPAEFAKAVEKLAEKLKETPDNAEGWGMLARSYVQMGRFSDAVPAFARAVALTGNDARLLADYADALAVNNNRSLEGEPSRLIERALKIDPNHQKALALAGTVSFNRQDYAGAVRHWEKLAEVAPPDSPFIGQVQQSIAEARQLGGLPAAADSAPKSTLSAPAAPAAAAAVTLRGTVRLAPALAAKASPEDTVFVFARPVEGSRMPLALLRRQVKDLPLTFALDDSMAMSPGAKLSLFAKVIVDARVSKSGQAAVAAGDLTGRSPPVANSASGVVVEIADVVRN